MHILAKDKFRIVKKKILKLYLTRKVRGENRRKRLPAIAGKDIGNIHKSLIDSVKIYFCRVRFLFL
jgi:hypothetical protein